MEYVDAIDDLAYITSLEQQNDKAYKRIAALSMLLEDAEFMLRNIGNHPRNADYMIDSINRFCSDARELLAKGTK